MNAQAERSETTNRQIIITRVFDAPRELVWQAWNEPQHVEKWFGPRGFTTRVEELDLRVGGRSRYVMVGPDGAEYPGKGVFREIVPLERIVTTDEFGDDFKYGDPGALPQGMVATYLFETVDGDKTRLTILIDHPTPEDRKKHEDMGVVGGWNSSLDCLEDQLAVMKKDPAGSAVAAAFASGTIAQVYRLAQ